MNQTTILSIYLHRVLPTKFTDYTHIEDISPLSGGDINDVYKVTYNKGTIVAKVNFDKRFPGMFEAEKSGLELLRKAGINTPKVISLGKEDNLSFLVLQYIDDVRPEPTFWVRFGKQLAAVHQFSSSYFGLDEDNYMGSLVQQNKPQKNWVEFFVTQRLIPQLKMAYDAGYLRGYARRFDQLMGDLDRLVPQENPALVHGDLWGGNFICGKGQVPVLIDPAAHYGHREADISIMHLFGGFNATLFDAYNKEFPLERGWQERIGIHNLYPLLVHVNLFGGAYEGQVVASLKHFTH